MRTILYREVNQEGKMLPSTKPDRFTGGGEQDRLTQATEIPLRFHTGLTEAGINKSMPALQRTVNNFQEGRLSWLSLCNPAYPHSLPGCYPAPARVMH